MQQRDGVTLAPYSLPGDGLRVTPAGVLPRLSRHFDRRDTRHAARAFSRAARGTHSGTHGHVPAQHAGRACALATSGTHGREINVSLPIRHDTVMKPVPPTPTLSPSTLLPPTAIPTSTPTLILNLTLTPALIPLPFPTPTLSLTPSLTLTSKP